MSRGINVDKLRKHQQEKAARSQVFYRPKDAEQRVRLVPPQNEDTLFFYESGYHKLGDTYFNCPAYANHECPICKKVRVLYNGTQEEKALAGDIRVRKQFYYNVIVRDDEFVKDGEGKATNEPNIKIMQVGIKLHNLVTNAILDNEIGDITDVDKGFDVIIRRKMVDAFPNYDDSVVSRKASPLFDNEEHVQYCLTHFKNAADFIKYPSPEDLAKNFEFYLQNGYCPTDATNTNNPESVSSNGNGHKPTEAPKTEKPKVETPKVEASKAEAKTSGSDSSSNPDYKSWQKEFENEFKDDDK